MAELGGSGKIPTLRGAARVHGEEFSSHYRSLCY